MPRVAIGLLLVLLLSAPLSPNSAAEGSKEEIHASRAFRAVRFETNPIVYPGLRGLTGAQGANINGPSLIRVPDWVEKPLGQYYLYFAHHNGTSIRLAYADTLEGPWKIYVGGVLGLADAPGLGHLASPDVHVDQDREEIRMYFHQPGPKNSPIPGQVSFVALDDLDRIPSRTTLAVVVA